jgi:hypothetical protein
MDMTVRQRALAIEQDARQYHPATAVNALAVRCAQLESALVLAQRRIAQLGAVAGWTKPAGAEPVIVMTGDQLDGAR